jgi:NADPH-dependent glutamate synthase beta subunit-like oxidoreductase/Pyruvate/2-oxoacid:ferredoxin oxidoreductase delta subunit
LSSEVKNPGTAGEESRITPSYRPKQVEKSAPCQGGCANCGDIRGWIGTVAQREKTGLSAEEAYEKAWRIITDVNPFPATLGRICPHPCEDHCNRSELDEPLAINAMERFLGDFAIRTGLPLTRNEEAPGDEWIGVIGAGPSGLSFAYQMARRGYRVTVYDARERAGGMLRYGVPDYRLPQDILEAEIQKILDLGIELKLGVEVGKDISLEELRSLHSSLYLGIGAQQGQALPIPGGEGPGVWTGTEYLGRINRGESVDIGKSVIVVGGGNTAIDAARCARRCGAEVTILYRRSREEMPAIAHEIDDALEEGVELVLLATPVSVGRGDDGRMETVRVQRMELGEPDASGRRSPVPVEGSEYDLTADTVIMAVSQVPVLQGLEALDHKGNWLIADSAGAVGENILAGGDALGLGIAGEAIVQGRRAAEALHARLSKGVNGRPAAGLAGLEIHGDRVRFASKPSSAAVHTPMLPPEERVRAGMKEVAGTVDEAQFLAEVQRCFSCGSCYGCEQCFMYCTSGCFTRLEEPQPGMYFSLNLDACKECGKCIEVCPCGFLEAS